MKQQKHTNQPQSPLTRVSRVRYTADDRHNDYDSVITELPLQISLCWQQQNQPQQQVFTVTMRTPGNDKALALGLLYAEGQIKTPAEIAAMDYEFDGDSELPNQLSVSYHPGSGPDLTHQRRQLVSQSSCGICGKTSLQAIELNNPPELDQTPAWLEPQQLCQLPDRLRQQQHLFTQSGGVHGAALFDQNYTIIELQEDIGRHNAVDKVFGQQLLNGHTAAGKTILLVSGRISFELVQKTIMAACPVLIAVGAPSSLAIDAAKRFDLTLIGFTKPNSFNVYHGHWRIKP